MLFLSLAYYWLIFPIKREKGGGMSEKLLFGVLIPAGIFLVSFLGTILIYRKFARQWRSSKGESRND